MSNKWEIDMSSGYPRMSFGGEVFFTADLSATSLREALESVLALYAKQSQDLQEARELLKELVKGVEE